jgi:adenosylcobinamide kinase / adenosylcobinamide-phosphate guanylyltransferase
VQSHKVILLIGGSRSGKSRYAENLAYSYNPERCFIATAQPFDDEMRERIARHQRDREGNFSSTIEEPLDLAKALERIPKETSVAVVDCMTVWMGNLMYHSKLIGDHFKEVQDFLSALQNPPCDIVIVTNEIGQGIVPGDAESRLFRDHAGWLNQDLAALAHTVVWMVAGIPVVIKGESPL